VARTSGQKLKLVLKAARYPFQRGDTLAARADLFLHRDALLRWVFEDAFNDMNNGTLLRQLINKLRADINFNQSKTGHLFGDIDEQSFRDILTSAEASRRSEAVLVGLPVENSSSVSLIRLVVGAAAASTRSPFQP
jgi:hypothetical protein